MGVVWRARDELLGRTVALKQLLIRPGLTDEQADRVRARAMREARISARIQHRNAVSMYDVVEHDGDPCLVMEHLASRSLSAVLTERGPLPPREVAGIGAQVAGALAAAHAVGVVHRDVKPGNILIGDNGSVKLTDFGISRAQDDGTVTHSGLSAGTPAYLAPEIAKGEEPGYPADVFSLGATLYHAVEGAPPFGTDANPLRLLHAVSSGKVTPPSRAGELSGALTKLLRVEPTERPSMAQTAALLETLPAETQVPVPAAWPVPPPAAAAAAPVAPAPAVGPSTMNFPAPAAPARPPRSGPNRRILVIAAVLLLVAAGVIAVLLTREKDAGTATAASTPSSAAAPPPPQTTSAQPTTTAPTPVAGKIDWAEAGRLVIAYYNSHSDQAKRWSMLSSRAQSQVGGQQAFISCTAQFTDVSARNAYGVTPNADGSVTVPVDVTHKTATGGSAEKRSLVVTRENGQLVIDADTGSAPCGIPPKSYG
ncbi:serine/threonine-protein kinase [Herbihabitans rhizosphaerae]